MAKMTDSERLTKMIEELQTDAYDFGAYIEFNELDVKNLKNPLIEALKNK
jgi:hypothetical protein